MPFDGTNFTQTEDQQDAPITWWDERRARLYVGWYNAHMREGKYSCMSSSNSHIRLTPIEEERFTRVVLNSIHERRDEWNTSERRIAAHRPSGTKFWWADGHSLFHVWGPSSIPLRCGSQWRIYRKLCRLREWRHRERHRTVTTEATALIAKFER